MGCLRLTYGLSLSLSLNLSYINLNTTISFTSTNTYIISLQSTAYSFKFFNIIISAPLI